MMNLDDMTGEERTSVLTEASYLFTLTMQKDAKDRDRECEQILQSPDFSYEVKKAYAYNSCKVKYAGIWAYKHLSGRQFSDLLTACPLAKHHTSSIIENSNLLENDIVKLFLSSSVRKIQRSSLFHELPDEKLITYSSKLWKHRKKLVVPENEVVERLKKAYGMENVPDEWFAEIVNS